MLGGQGREFTLHLQAQCAASCLAVTSLAVDSLPLARWLPVLARPMPAPVTLVTRLCVGLVLVSEAFRLVDTGRRPVEQNIYLVLASLSLVPLMHVGVALFL